MHGCEYMLAYMRPFIAISRRHCHCRTISCFVCLFGRHKSLYKKTCNTHSRQDVLQHILQHTLQHTQVMVQWLQWLVLSVFVQDRNGVFWNSVSKSFETGLLKLGMGWLRCIAINGYEWLRMAMNGCWPINRCWLLCMDARWLWIAMNGYAWLWIHVGLWIYINRCWLLCIAMHSSQHLFINQLFIGQHLFTAMHSHS